MSTVMASARRAAVGSAFVLASLSTMVPSSARAADISQHDCYTISETVMTVVKRVGPATLSAEFKSSLLNFLKPDGSVTCKGTRDILTPTGNDIDTFNTIQDFLEAGSRPINLKQAGIRSVDPAKLSSSKPEPIKRSALPSTLAAD